MHKNPTVILLNKHARQLRKNHQAILECIQKQDVNLDVRLLSPKKLQKELKEILHNAPDRIVVGGGDGTIVSAANLMAKSRTALGVLPLGTTNSFARSLNLPLDFEAALKLAIHGKAQDFNLGSADGHSFVAVAAIGLSESVASSINDKTKKRFGRLAYVLVGTWQFIRKPAFDVHVTTSKKEYSFRTRQVVVANARYHGSLPVMQDASINQDVLVILSFGRAGTKREHLRNLWRYLRGIHTQSSETVALKVTEATITTSPKRRIELDGEVRGKTPVTVKLEKDALKVIAQ